MAEDEESRETAQPIEKKKGRPVLSAGRRRMRNGGGGSHGASGKERRASVSRNLADGPGIPALFWGSGYPGGWPGLLMT